MNPYLIYIKIGAAVAIVLAIFGAGHHFGAKGVQTDWDSEKLTHETEDKAAILAAVAENDRIHALDVKQSAETINQYQKDLDEADKRIAGERATFDRERLRLRVPARTCPATSPEAASPVLADGTGATEEIQLPAAIESSLRTIAEDADREIAAQTAKIQAFQKWARDHGFAQ